MQIILHFIRCTDNVLRFYTPVNEGNPQRVSNFKNLQIYSSVLLLLFSFLHQTFFLVVDVCWKMSFNARFCVVPPGLIEFIHNRGQSPSYSLYFFLGQQWPDPKNKPWEKKLIMVEVMKRLSLFLHSYMHVLFYLCHGDFPMIPIFHL